MKRILPAAAAALAFAPFAAKADGPAVVGSIKPVHSLVANVMEGVGEPRLLISGAASPHTYSMKPSDAKSISEADTIFWIGEALETFLEEPLSTLGEDAHVVELAEAPGLTLLPVREGATFEAHAHEDQHEEGHEQEAGHEDHDHGHEEGEHHDESAEADHDHEHEGEHQEAHDHGHDGIDAHLWLDPENAKVMVKVIEGALVSADPNNAATYANNAANTLGRLDALIEELDDQLAPARGQPFIVFHDAYQYFENRFGLSAAGSVTVSPEVQPGAGRIQEIREKVDELGAVCVFAEPQFPPRLIEVVAEGTDLRTGTLDPLGADLADGPDQYFDLVRNMADSLASCLTEAG